MTNITSQPLDWTVDFNVEGTLYTNWNATMTQTGNKVTAEGVGWNNILQPSESTHDIGFCANKTTPTDPPTGLEVQVTKNPD